MVNINDINATINHYENQPTTLENCRILADLYICRENNIDMKDDNEADDILPAYIEYIDVKREYQLNRDNAVKLKRSIDNVCKELKEFIHILYNNTDTQYERDIIKDTLANSMKEI